MKTRSKPSRLCIIPGNSTMTMDLGRVSVMLCGRSMFVSAPMAFELRRTTPHIPIDDLSGKIMLLSNMWMRVATRLHFAAYRWDNIGIPLHGLYTMQIEEKDRAEQYDAFVGAMFPKDLSL